MAEPCDEMKVPPEGKKKLSAAEAKELLKILKESTAAAMALTKTAQRLYDKVKCNVERAKQRELENQGVIEPKTMRGTACRLRMYEDDGTLGNDIFVLNNELSIGRNSLCDVVFKDIKGLEEKHCIVTVEDDGRAFLDPVYKEGLTYINAELIESREVLKDNDVITVVKKSFLFNYPYMSEFSATEENSNESETEDSGEESESSDSEDVSQEEPPPKKILRRESIDQINDDLGEDVIENNASYSTNTISFLNLWNQMQMAHKNMPFDASIALSDSEEDNWERIMGGEFMNSPLQSTSFYFPKFK